MAVVIGTTHIGRLVADILAANEGRDSLRFVAEQAGAATVDGIPVFGSIGNIRGAFDTIPPGGEVLVALDSPVLASQVVEQLAEFRVFFPGRRDLSAHVSERATVGQGAIILPHATICPGAVIGRHAIVGIGAVVGCDARVEDFARIPDGAHIQAAAVVSA